VAEVASLKSKIGLIRVVLPPSTSFSSAGTPSKALPVTKQRVPGFGVWSSPGCTGCPLMALGTGSTRSQIPCTASSSGRPQCPAAINLDVVHPGPDIQFMGERGLEPARADDHEIQLLSRRTGTSGEKRQSEGSQERAFSHRDSGTQPGFIQNQDIRIGAAQGSGYRSAAGMAPRSRSTERGKGLARIRSSISVSLRNGIVDQVAHGPKDRRIYPQGEWAGPMVFVGSRRDHKFKHMLSTHYRPGGRGKVLG